MATGKRFGCVMAVCAAMLTANLQATDYYWVGASNDWWNAASYSLTSGGAGGTVMPGRDDEIIVPSGSELYADDTTIAFFGTVGAIHMNADNVRFTVTITTNSVFGCPIGQLTRDDYNSSGTGTAFTNHIFVKEGPGKLTFDTSNKACVGGAYNLNTGFHVKEGEIDFGASWGPKINHTFKRLIVEKDATVHCMTNGAMYFKGIWGAGTIAGPTSANSALKFLINQSPEQRMDPEALDVPTVFSGKITGSSIGLCRMDRRSSPARRATSPHPNCRFTAFRPPGTMRRAASRIWATRERCRHSG